MIQWHDFTHQRIDTTQIWPLPKIAAVTSQRQISGIVGSSVLLRDNVFNVVDQLAILFMEQTVLATVLGTMADQLPNRGLHR